MIQFFFRLESHISLLLTLMELAEVVLLLVVGLKACIVVKVSCQVIADRAAKVLLVQMLHKFLFILEPLFADMAPWVHPLDVHLKHLAVKEVVATEVAPWMLQLWSRAVFRSTPPIMLACLLHNLSSHLLGVETPLLAYLVRAAIEEDFVESLLICILPTWQLLIF